MHSPIYHPHYLEEPSVILWRFIISGKLDYALVWLMAQHAATRDVEIPPSLRFLPARAHCSTRMTPQLSSAYTDPGHRLTQDDALHWLALRMTPGLGTRTAVRLIEIFRTAQSIFRSSPSELQAAGLPQNLARSVASGCAFDDAVTQQQKLAEAGAMLIPYTDPLYPARLKEIFDPPPMLFAKGRIELLVEPDAGHRRHPASHALRDRRRRAGWRRTWRPPG